MKKRMTLMLAGLASLMIVLSACQQGGLNSDDATMIRQQLEDVANRLDVVEDRIQDLAADEGGSEMLISQVRSELNQARTTLAEVDDKLANGDEDDGALNDTFSDDLNDFGNDAQDTLDGMGDSLNQFGDDVNEGFDDFGNDVDQRFDDLQDDLNDGTGNDTDPAQPGTGGGSTDTVPGIPAAPGM